MHDANGQYDAGLHLAEMIALLGPPPRELLSKSKAMSEHNWPQPVRNDSGKLCSNAQEFFCGPFFDVEGESEIIVTLRLCVLTASKANSSIMS